MKPINTPYYNNNNIEILTSKISITITAKTIKNIKLLWEKKPNINRKSKKKNYYYYCINNEKKKN